MKATSIRVLKGMIINAMRRDRDIAEETYKTARKANEGKIKAAVEKAIKDFKAEFFAHPEKYMDIDRSGESFGIGHNDAAAKLRTACIKKYRAITPEPQYRSLNCYSLDIDGRTSLDDAAYEKYQKMFADIDTAFINDDGAEIMTIIKKYLTV